MILLANNFLPLAAMTRSNNAGDCRMACCKFFKRHHKLSSSSASCPMMGKNNASHESMTAAMAAEKPTDKKSNSKKLPAEIFKAEFYSVGKTNKKISDNRFHTNQSENKHIPSLLIKFAGKCDQTACGGGGNSFSNSGKRQQQPSDNCPLRTFADQPRPPTAISVNLKIQFTPIFKSRALSRSKSSRGPPFLIS